MADEQLIDPLAYDENGEERFWPYLDPDHPGYQASRLGNAKLKNGKLAKLRLLKGYYDMSLSGPSGRKYIYIHVMVARMFLPPPLPGQTEINHINGKRDDNRAVNLEWCTSSENSLRQVSPGNRKAVLEVTADGDVIRRWKSLTQALQELSDEYFDNFEKETGDEILVKTVVNRHLLKKACADPPVAIDGRHFRFESKPSSISPELSTLLDHAAPSVLKLEPDYRFKSYSPSLVMYWVAQLDLDGKFIRAHRSATHSSVTVGGTPGLITACVRGEIRTAYGYIWRRATREERDTLFRVPPPSCEVFGTWKYLDINDSRILVSSHGFIVSGGGRLHLGSPDHAGYYVIGVNGKQYFVHRLVMLAFEPVDDWSQFVVDHINHNRSDNHLSNLRWATTQQNVMYSRARPVEQLDLDGHVLARFESIKQGADACGCSYSNLAAALGSQRLTAYGYKWRYAE